MEGPAFAELAAALRERIAVIADREAALRDSAAHMDRLRAASERIGRAAGALPRPVDPRLEHFIEGCSFAKALAWLEEKGL
jgi:hypothetical protein